MSTNRPIAVLVSDIHYSVPTLELADAAMRQAIAKANELDVPLIVAGDLHDTKANMRAECVNRMIETFYGVISDTFILRGNHDSINEKSQENALQFLLSPRVAIVNKPTTLHRPTRIELIPYHHDPDELRTYLKTVPKGATIIMHQGIEGSHSGDYIQDKSAITHEDVKDFRVISGHYHRRQDIKTGRPQKNSVGLFSYIGNPYTLNFAEASDPDKGFQILMDDGMLEFVPTNLRRHVVYDFAPGVVPVLTHSDSDIIKVKLYGANEWLAQFSKEDLALAMSIKQDFKLELIPDASESDIQQVNTSLPQTEVLDSIIDSLTNTSAEQKNRVKELWKSLT